MAKVTGTCNSRFAAVKELLQSKIDADEELGASLVVNINGENVVDIWGGYTDAAKTKPWEENTITNVWSSSKTIVSLAALLLIERKQLDPFEKVCKYWPEFAANGKQDVEVRHILSHSSGVSGWEAPITIDGVYDTEAAAALLATQAPWWTPGTASGYHSLTMGHLVNELSLRITGLSISQFIAAELTTPLAADFQFGVAPHDSHRVADIIPPPAPPTSTTTTSPFPPNSLAAKTLLNPPMDAATANTPAWRSATVPAANGHTNARALALLTRYVSCNGTIGPHTLLSPSTIDLIFTQQTLGPDLVIGATTRFGIGFGLNGAGPQGAGFWLPEGEVAFWGGWGGSVVVMDRGRGVTICYAMNKMGHAGLGSGLAREYVGEVYRALGVES